jgi:hypothetical protein
VPLLTNSRFRQYVMQQPALPPHVRDYWQRFNRLSENETAQVVAPIINKIEAFTNRTPIRLMLGQSQGIDFEDMFRKRLVVLVNLASGDLGEETANLFGALVMAELWRAARTRGKVAPEQRRPVFAYIDEAQSIVKLPIAMESLLAQARGFKLGLCLANQYVAQLPESIRAAVLGTVKTQITFAVEPEDAKLLATRFAPLTADDLMGLPAFELAMRPCVGAQTLTPVTGISLPLDKAYGDAEAIARQSRTRYGLPRAAVEQQLASRVQALPTRSSRFGQEEAV